MTPRARMPQVTPTHEIVFEEPGVDGKAAILSDHRLAVVGARDALEAEAGHGLDGLELLTAKRPVNQEASERALQEEFCAAVEEKKKW